MTVPVRRAVRERRAALDLQAFAETLIAALELPEVRRAVADAVAAAERRAAKRNPPAVYPATAAQARDFKTSRLAARGRGSRG